MALVGNSDTDLENYNSQSAPLLGFYIVHGVWSRAKYRTGRLPTNRSAVDFDGKCHRFSNLYVESSKVQIVFSTNINVVMSVSHTRCVSYIHNRHSLLVLLVVISNSSYSNLQLSLSAFVFFIKS